MPFVGVRKRDRMLRSFANNIGILIARPAIFKFELAKIMPVQSVPARNVFTYSILRFVSRSIRKFSDGFDLVYVTFELLEFFTRTIL